MLPLRMLGLLLLMFLLCDADSTCPTELNALTLDPPEIIGEYGKSVLVNCSNIDLEHDGMYWRVENKDSELEEDYSFITKTVLMSDWNVEAQCKIKLNGTGDKFECSKDLKITVYKNPDDVFLYPINHLKAAVEETQYDLQCDIINVAPVQNLTVRWYRNNQLIMTTSFTNTTKTPVSESSVLTVNISRGDNGAQFRCEAQLDFWPHGPQCPVISSDIHNVSVHYAPEFKNKTDFDAIYVREGDNVTLNCEAEGNPPPVFHWTKDGVNILENTNNLYINQVNNGTIYNCTATNNLGSVTKQIHVHVEKTAMINATPEASEPTGCPLILKPAEIVVRFGDPASIDCSTSATDAQGMGWEASVGGTGFEKLLAVPWRVNKLEDWFMEPKCYVTLKKDQCDVTPVITLYKTPDIVSVSASDHDPMVEGTEHQLKCDIINVAPVRNLKVKWYRGNETVHTQIFNDTSVTPVNVSSTLEVTPERDYNGSHFRCEAELHLGPKGPAVIPTKSSAPYIAVVHYKPLIQSCPTRYAGVEHEFSMEMVPCQADGNPPPTVHWYNQGSLINASEPLTRTHSGEYTAEFVNIIGKTNTSVYITIEYSPSFTCNDRYDVEENSAFQTKCVPAGIPTPNITWFKDGKEMAPLQHWTKHDNGTYLLRATNKHGRANHTLYLDVLYAPAFKEGDYNKEMTLGENVTFGCSAEGNPPPQIIWRYKSAVNVGETTRGRQKTISITGATSTNAGVYICNATNKVGNVTRSVTLRMKDETSTAAFPLWLLILLVIITIIVLSIILIISLKSRKKHGQYSFIPNGLPNGLEMQSVSPGMQA